MENKSYGSQPSTTASMMLSWPELEIALAPERLSPYLRYAKGDCSYAVALYLWNMSLRESLYPLLSLSEISLRNQFNRALSQHFGREDWYEIPWLDQQDASKVNDAKNKIKKQGYDVAPGRVVAELTFGFWTSLLNVRYERKQILWPTMAPLLFASAPRKLRTRKDQSRYASQLRNLRNRIFHYEPIWHWPNLPSIVRESEAWLQWLSPDIARLHGQLERFHSIYVAGPKDMPNIATV